MICICCGRPIASVMGISLNVCQCTHPVLQHEPMIQEDIVFENQTLKGALQDCRKLLAENRTLREKVLSLEEKLAEVRSML